MNKAKNIQSLTSRDFSSVLSDTQPAETLSQLIEQERKYTKYLTNTEEGINQSPYTARYK